MAAHRGIGAQSAQSFHPRLVLLQRIDEMRRVRAVDHVVSRRTGSGVIGLLDRRAHGFAARQSAVGFGGERDHHRHARRLGCARNADRFAGMGHGEGADQVGFGVREQLALECVIALCLLAIHHLVGKIAVAARADIARNRHRALRRLELVAQRGQQRDAPAVQVGELRQRKPELRAPVRTSTPGRAFEHEAGVAGLRDLDVLHEIIPQPMFAIFARMQRDRGHVWEFDSVVEDQGGFQPRIGQESLVAELRQIRAIFRHRILLETQIEIWLARLTRCPLNGSGRRLPHQGPVRLQNRWNRGSKAATDAGTARMQ